MDPLQVLLDVPNGLVELLAVWLRCFAEGIVELVCWLIAELTFESYKRVNGKAIYVVLPWLSTG